mgnify:CR=1 FL=1
MLFVYRLSLREVGKYVEIIFNFLTEKKNLSESFLFSWSWKLRNPKYFWSFVFYIISLTVT